MPMQVVVSYVGFWSGYFGSATQTGLKIKNDFLQQKTKHLSKYQPLQTCAKNTPNNRIGLVSKHSPRPQSAYRTQNSRSVAHAKIDFRL